MQQHDRDLQSDSEVIICPRCGMVLQLSDDGSRGYCNNKFCHAMVMVSDIR